MVPAPGPSFPAENSTAIPATSSAENKSVMNGSVHKPAAIESPIPQELQITSGTSLLVKSFPSGLIAN